MSNRSKFEERGFISQIIDEEELYTGVYHKIGNNWYDVTYSDGLIISKGKDCKQMMGKDGYKIVYLWDVDFGKYRRVDVHKVVALLAVPGYKKGLEVDHKDGNKTNNSPENLEWVTHKENMRRMWERRKYDKFS